MSCQHSREAEEMPEPRAGMLPASRLRQEAPGERRTGCEAGTREQRFACSRGTPLGGYRRTSEMALFLRGTPLRYPHRTIRG